MKRGDVTKIVLGTRGSELAQIQARSVADKLRERWADLVIETKIIRTSGDEGKNARDLKAGRKGLFTAEIERALVHGDVDLAVHSAKDLPSEPNDLTSIIAVLERASVDDVLVATTPCDLTSLPMNAIVATGSVRRKHQLRWKRPDVEVVDLRGNVPTRLAKLAQGGWHAIILARAGLDRLGLRKDERVQFEGREFPTAILPRDIFLPAGGQGVIALQARAGDDGVKMIVEAINHFETRLCLRAEREFLRLLQGDCDQPVGVLATIDKAGMTIQAQVFEPGATSPRQGVVEGPAEDAERLGAKLFQQMGGIAS